jgi:hypothetical protein
MILASVRWQIEIEQDANRAPPQMPWTGVGLRGWVFGGQDTKCLVGLVFA